MEKVVKGCIVYFSCVNQREKGRSRMRESEQVHHDDEEDENNRGKKQWNESGEEIQGRNTLSRYTFKVLIRDENKKTCSITG